MKKFYYRRGYEYTLRAFIKSFFIRKTTIDTYLKRCTYPEGKEKEVRRWILCELSSGNLQVIERTSFPGFTYNAEIMNRQNIDLLGNEVKTGDVLLELGRGWGSLTGSEYKYHMQLWEMPKKFDGHAYEYSIDGSKHIFAWASTKNSIKVDMSTMPCGFEHSFKHGMSDISSKIENGTLDELIENSNWKEREVKKEQVARFEFMKTLEINTIDDLKANIDELTKGGYVPSKIVSKVLELSGIGRAAIHNGEIGIAGMYDQMHYHAVIEAIKKETDE